MERIGQIPGLEAEFYKLYTELMKSYNTVYYLLTVLLIMGGFASMAQNSYGMPIISAVCMAFGLVFFIQFIQALRANEPNRAEQAIEFFALFVLAFIFTLRTLQIYFPFIEWIFVAAAAVLALNYFTRLRHWFRLINQKNKMLAGLVLIAYLSVLLFCIAMVEITLKPRIARWTGGLALLLVFVFLLPGSVQTGSHTFYWKEKTGPPSTSLYPDLKTDCTCCFLCSSSFLCTSVCLARTFFPNCILINFPRRI